MVVRVDPDTGDRTLLSADNSFTKVKKGNGPIVFPFGVAIEASGDVVVADPRLAAVFRVDLATGDRTVVSGCPEVNCTAEAVVGSGEPFGTPVGITVVDNVLYVLDRARLGLFRVDPVTGNRELLLANGPADDELLLTVPLDLAFDEPNGSLVVANLGRTIVRVNPLTGAAEPVSSRPADELNRDAPFFPTDVVVDKTSGEWLAVDVARGAIVRLNPATGRCEVVSGESVFGRIGSGPALILPGIATDKLNNLWPTRALAGCCGWIPPA